MKSSGAMIVEKPEKFRSSTGFEPVTSRFRCDALCTDWMHCLATSNQCGANSVTVAPWHTKSRPRMLVASKAAFLENYLAVSACILNGSSIEWHEKKRQPFSLSGIRFERRAILISG